MNKTAADIVLLKGNLAEISHVTRRARRYCAWLTGGRQRITGGGMLTHFMPPL